MSTNAMTYRVELGTAGPFGLINVRAGLAARPLLEAALGATLPCVANTTSRTDNLTAFWLGPDEWLLRVPDGREQALAGTLRRGAASHHSAVTVVSDAYVSFHMAGPDVKSVLAQGTGIDIHPAVFMPGQCARVRFAKAQALIYYLDEPQGYHVYVARSYEQYLRLWLKRALSG
jgi:sarcosine oxidase, subunit gamma